VVFEDYEGALNMTIRQLLTSWLDFGEGLKDEWWAIQPGQATDSIFSEGRELEKLLTETKDFLNHAPDGNLASTSLGETTDDR